MEIQIYKSGNNYLFHVRGRILLDECEYLKNALLPLITRGVDQVAVNLQDVDFIDSAGLGVLVGMKMTCSKNKVKLLLLSPSKNVGEILFVSKLDSIFEILSNSAADKLRQSMMVPNNLMPMETGPSPVASQMAAVGPRLSAIKLEQVERGNVQIPAKAEAPAKSDYIPDSRFDVATPSSNIGPEVRVRIDDFCKSAVELMRQGDLDKAVEFYQRALEIDPAYIPALNNLAIVFEKKPVWATKAIETWERVLKISQSIGDQKHIDRAQKHLSGLRTNF
ncbi:MAG: anti-sigma factor antagonist [bacterium]